MFSKKNIWKFLRYFLAIFMVFGGVQHFLKPDFYIPFVPRFLPEKMMIVYLSGVAEIAVGFLLFLPAKFARIGAFLTFLMMLAFLPVHASDVIIEQPAIGSHQMAWIRLVIQFFFIYWTWGVSKSVKSQESN